MHSVESRQYPEMLFPNPPMKPPTLKTEVMNAKLLQYSYSAPAFCSELRLSSHYKRIQKEMKSSPLSVLINYRTEFHYAAYDTTWCNHQIGSGFC
jgi:hypothetical protein